MEDYSPEGSKWNQEFNFSKIFFELSSRCRTAQSMGDLLLLKKFVESKFQHSIAIITPKESEDIKRLLKEVDKLADGYMVVMNNNQYKNNVLKVNSSIHQVYKQFSKSLSDAEGQLDIYVNKYMKFLNKREKGDLSGL